MNLKSLSLQAIDKLVEYWATDTAKSVAESREESAAVIEAVYVPVIDDLEQVAEMCDAEIAKRQELDCQIFDLERRLDLARDALVLCIPALGWDSSHPKVVEAKAAAIDAYAQLGAPSMPSPVEGSWDWVLCQKGRRVTRPTKGKRDYLGILSNGELIFGNRFWLYAEDFTATDWRIADGEKP